MTRSEIIMMAFIWGALFIYFLIPFQENAETGQYSKMKFTQALKESFIKITFHKKAALAFILLLATLFAVWWSQTQNVLYNEMHGISTPEQPPNYIEGIIIYAIIIYLTVIGRRALKLI
ncbi:hypothetical protein ABET51_07960 [Metabacillus fastidiosus]|uniref:hypothetical protein n=1 Tax=Metabacillus fastidiosus TaxID=1458 RepID=UPI002E1B2B25|nr:hypothetical protein [Metabacillus fastidiosus]